MLRQRKKKPKAPAARKVAARRSRGPKFTDFLAFIGIRPLKPSPPLTPHLPALRIDFLIATLLLLVTLATRFYRLASPAKIVFDEFHFAEFVDQYVRGEYLFDIHPPLGKLTLAAAAKLSGYKSINYTFDALGKPYGDLIYYPQRAFSAFVGSFIPPVLYATIRTMHISRPVALTVAAMPTFDMLLCIESRLILTDAQLILFAQTSLLFALLLWQTPKNTPRRYGFLVLTAVFGAFAVSTKWTAIVAPGMIAIVSITGAVFPTEGILDIVEMAVAGALAIAIYVACFWVHFKLLPHSGRGDAFMPFDFQKALVGNKFYDPDASMPSFWENFKYLNFEMLRANNAIETRHPWESKWYEWLYNAKGILYIDDPAPGGRREQIYLIMNPVLTAVSTLGVIACVAFLIALPILLIRSRNRDIHTDAGKERIARVRRDGGMILFFLFGWITNLMPYIGIKRCTFLYHVLPALQMACILTAIALEQLPARYFVRHCVCAIIVISMAAAFYRWRPWVYGLHRTPTEIDQLRLLPTWT